MLGRRQGQLDSPLTAFGLAQAHRHARTLAAHRSPLAAIARHSERPLVVSHEMIGRMLLRNLLAEPPEDALARHHPHDVIYEVRQGVLRRWPPAPEIQRNRDHRQSGAH